MMHTMLCSHAVPVHAYIEVREVSAPIFLPLHPKVCDTQDS